MWEAVGIDGASSLKLFIFDYYSVCSVYYFIIICIGFGVCEALSFVYTSAPLTRCAGRVQHVRGTQLILIFREPEASKEHPVHKKDT